MRHVPSLARDAGPSRWSASPLAKVNWDVRAGLVLLWWHAEVPRSTRRVLCLMSHLAGGPVDLVEVGLGDVEDDSILGDPLDT